MNTNHCFTNKIWCRHHESNAGPTDYKLVAEPLRIKALARFFVPRNRFLARLKSITYVLLCLSLFVYFSARIRQVALPITSHFFCLTNLTTSMISSVTGRPL